MVAVLRDHFVRGTLGKYLSVTISGRVSGGDDVRV
jgi:hypothetical protein